MLPRQGLPGQCIDRRPESASDETYKAPRRRARGKVANQMPDAAREASRCALARDASVLASSVPGT
jgi:hypothetical protein